MIKFNSKTKKNILWSTLSILLLILIYPVINWLIINPCRYKTGGIEAVPLASYASLSDFNKEIYIRRFISIEYFKYPYFNIEKFEFNFIAPLHDNTINQIKVDDQVYKYNSKVLSKKFLGIPDTIYVNYNDTLGWEQFVIYNRNDTSINKTPPTYWEMFEYGPTLKHIYDVCH